MSAAGLIEVAPSAPDEPGPGASPSSAPGLGLGRRLAARFALLAFGLYYLPLVPNDYPTFGGGGFENTGISHAWGAVYGQVGLWVARHIFQVTGPIAAALDGDNGDTAEEYCRLLVGVVLAAAVAATWSVADRRRPRGRWVEPALRVVLRYSIALGLASYAMAKLYPVQFGQLTAMGLESRVGELRPMRLLWHFMESSHPYSIFAGAVEMVVVVLVSFRRTATLGALLCITVMLNVALMNLCYGVPVKLFSTVMVATAVVLASYDGRRLLGALGLGPAQPPPVWPRLSRRRQLIGWVAKIGLIGGVIVSSAVGMHRYRTTIVAGDASPVRGTWQAQSFIKDGRDLMQTADPTRWRRFIASLEGVAIRFEDDSFLYCAAKLDDAAHTLALSCDRTHQDGALHWVRDGDTLRIDGTFDRAPVTATFQRIDETQFRLLSTPFEWTFD